MTLADYSLKRRPRNPLEWLIIEAGRVLWKIPKANTWTTGEYRQKLHKVGFINSDIKEVGELTIPGYYFEQKRREVKRELTRIRGFLAGRLGHVVDIVAFYAYKFGLTEYVIVRAEKPL